MAAPKMFDLSGEVAVVTGGNGGIGRGIALGLAEAGASVAILARNEEKNRAVLEELGRSACPHGDQLDVTRRDDLAPAMAEVERELGPVSILVNNAGIAIMRSALKFRAEDWDRVIETNLNSCFFLSQIAARSMVARKHGKIINIASEYSLFGARREYRMLQRRARWCRRPRGWRSSWRRTTSRSTRSCRAGSKPT